MKYENRKRGFSIEVPDDWKKGHRILLFWLTGGKIVFRAPEAKAEINISLGKPDNPKWLFQKYRREAMLDFFRYGPPKNNTKWFKEINIEFGGEENTVAFEHEGNNQEKRKIISTVRNGIEYVLQSNDTDNYSPEIEKIIQSFKFL